jgi:Peptidase family M23
LLHPEIRGYGGFRFVLYLDLLKSERYLFQRSRVILDEIVETASNAMNSSYIWPLSQSSTPDEMNTSFGPRIDADKWDFHDGIDLPAPIGTPVFAMRAGKVFRAGPGEPDKNVRGFHSRHVLIEVEDPSGDKVYLVYLHLDSIASGINVGANVSQGQLIGTVGEDDATYPHLHFEFRKGSYSERASVHPLNYLPYTGAPSFSDPVLDRCNRSASTIAVQITCEADSKLQGDLLAAEVNLLENGQSLEASPRRVNFDDKTTISEGKGDHLRFNGQDIAVEGYQKSDMVKDGRTDLHYGILVRNVPLNCDSLVATLFNVSGDPVASATVQIPSQIPSQDIVDDTVDFEGGVFPPQDWEKVRSTSGAGTSVSVVSSASASRRMRCVDASTTETTAQRAGIERPLPPGRFEWLAQARFKPEALTLKRSESVLLLRFTDGEHPIAAAHINRGRNKFWAGITVTKPDGTLKARNSKHEIKIGVWRKWDLHLLRLGTRETTAVLSLDSSEALRLDWDTAGVELLRFRVGIASMPAKASGVILCDELRLTEDTL